MQNNLQCIYFAINWERLGEIKLCCGLTIWTFGMWTINNLTILSSNLIKSVNLFQLTTVIKDKTDQVDIMTAKNPPKDSNLKQSTQPCHSNLLLRSSRSYNL